MRHTRQGVDGVCKTLGETRAWFDSKVAHQHAKVDNAEWTGTCLCGRLGSQPRVRHPALAQVRLCRALINCPSSEPAATGDVIGAAIV